MTQSEFNALKNWMQQRFVLMSMIEKHPNDQPRTESLRKEIEELDEEMADTLVTEGK